MMREYLKSLAPKCLYSVVVYFSLIAVSFGRAEVAAVLIVVAVNKFVDRMCDEARAEKGQDEKNRLSNLENEVKQLNLALSFKNLHK